MIDQDNTSNPDAANSLTILGLSGSLRRDSYNTALIRAAVELAPRGSVVEPATLEGIPLFNEDEERAGVPAAVLALASRVTAADALLVGTPEYNYSIPGVLKNALDWMSRKSVADALGKHAGVFAGKPVAIIGASPGAAGTVRSQLHLRQVFVYLDLHPLYRPELMVGAAHEKFDDEGTLIDQASRDRLARVLAELAEAALRLRGESRSTSRPVQ